MRNYKIGLLGKIQLKRLRKDIILCSLYLHDYNNRYNINVHDVFVFFDGYSDYLSELMTAAGVPDKDFFKMLSKYDTLENLLYYQKYMCSDYFH